MAESVLLGHFLTRREAASRAGIDAMTLVTRRDVLRIGGRSLEEVYFAFQFGQDGLRPEVGNVVAALASAWDHLTIARWLTRSNRRLEGHAPLVWLNAGRDHRRVVDAATADAAIEVSPAARGASADAAA